MHQIDFGNFLNIGTSNAHGLMNLLICGAAGFAEFQLGNNYVADFHYDQAL